MFIEKICKQLAKRKIKYAVVGGYAVALHGAVRGTMDVDLVVKHSLKSFENIEAALKEIGLESRLPVSAKEVFQFREEYIQNRNLIAWSFVNPQNPIEVVDIIITHDLDQMKTINKKAGKLTIPILAIEDLIVMKQATGREQDKADVAALEKLK